MKEDTNTDGYFRNVPTQTHKRKTKHHHKSAQPRQNSDQRTEGTKNLVNEAP